jgi:hypothetical protein
MRLWDNTDRSWLVSSAADAFPWSPRAKTKDAEQDDDDTPCRAASPRICKESHISMTCRSGKDRPRDYTVRVLTRSGTEKENIVPAESGKEKKRKEKTIVTNPQPHPQPQRLKLYAVWACSTKTMKFYNWSCSSAELFFFFAWCGASGLSYFLRTYIFCSSIP